MYKKLRIIAPIFISLLLSFREINAQNQASKWYFGSYAGLDFMTNPPTPLNNSAMTTTEGCSTVSDAAGNLLFYTDGVTVWNQQHAIMANGWGLFGGNSPSQSCFILKKPGSSNLYYIFTVRGLLSATGLNYSVVDMNLAAGMGSVTVMNASLFPMPCTEKLAATRHANGVDFWVVAHEANTNNFRAYLLTAAGVSTTAVISSVGTIDANYLGCMKISPTGQKLAAPKYAFNQMELYDFDNSTGVVSNPINFSGSGPNLFPYGCEFSPDGTKFYTTTLNPFTIMQWNLAAGSDAAIISSSVSVLNIPVSYGSMQMQLAPNGKIYVAARNSQSLTVIHKPNVQGIACNAVFGDQFVGITNINTNNPALCWDGLPNVMTYPCFVSFSVLTNSISCSGLSTGSVAAVNAAGNPTYLWSNGSTSFTTSQGNGLSAGSWTVTVTDTTGCSTRSVIAIAQLQPGSFTPSISASGFSICPGATVALTASGANSYTWNNGAQSAGIVVSPASTTQYLVTGANTNGCLENSSPITVSVFPAPDLEISGPLHICSAQTITLSVSGAPSCLWKWRVTYSATTPSIVVNLNSTTQFSVSGTNQFGCTSTKIVTVNVGCAGLGQRQGETDNFSIYPNPASAAIYVNMGYGYQATAVEVIDAFGKEITGLIHDFSGADEQVLKIDVNGLDPGLYFIRLENKVLRFVKE